MQTNYADLYGKAIEEAGLGSEVLPDDTYNVKIATIKPDTAKNGKFKVGLRLQVLDGPHAGKSTWVNQTFTEDNPKAVGIFIRILKEFGVPQEAVAAGLPPAQLVAYIVQGSTGVAVLGHHVHGTNPDGTGKKWQDVKSFRLAAVAPQAAAPAPAVPVPAVAAPEVPQAPAAPEAPVAAPPLPAQPAPVVAGAAPAPF